MGLGGKGYETGAVHTLQISLRALFLCSGEGCVDEGVVFAEACEVVGLAARRADSGEGGTLLGKREGWC